MPGKVQSHKLSGRLRSNKFSAFIYSNLSLPLSRSLSPPALSFATLLLFYTPHRLSFIQFKGLTTFDLTDWRKPDRAGYLLI
jgi:hypothetical protein